MRQRLEVTDPELAYRVVVLALQLGIKPTARELHLSKNTVRAIIDRQGLDWAVRYGALNRRIFRMVNKWAGVDDARSCRSGYGDQRGV